MWQSEEGYIYIYIWVRENKLKKQLFVIFYVFKPLYIETFRAWTNKKAARGLLIEFRNAESLNLFVGAALQKKIVHYELHCFEVADNVS